jgi:uncharacterized protein
MRESARYGRGHDNNCQYLPSNVANRAACGSATERGPTITTWLKEVFHTEKVAIGMVHLPALPGSPLHDREGGMELVVERTRSDLEALQGAGFDAVMFCNENDRPYVFTTGAETVAAMSAVVAGLKPLLTVPFGVDLLWDPCATLAVAKATGAAFVREVFTGVYASEFGLWNTDPGASMRYRRQIDASGVRILTNISAEFAAPVAERDLGHVARGVDLISLADAICVSGPMTGASVDGSQLQSVRDALPDAVVFANTGVKEETVAGILAIADGVVVGTSLKVDGITWNPVDADRAERFMARVKAVREGSYASSELSTSGV